LHVKRSSKNNIYLTDNALHKINLSLADVMKRYAIPKDKFVIGGYSGGGINSLNYTIHCKQFPEKAVIDPQGVFTAEPLLTLTEVWRSLNREIEKNF
jgi:predicted esterase